MLLHAFPSMFVSSFHEFSENCVYQHVSTVLLIICTENYQLTIFSLMILKVLKKSSFIGFAY
jgi:hypothetical protein